MRGRRRQHFLTVCTLTVVGGFLRAGLPQLPVRRPLGGRRLMYVALQVRTRHLRDSSLKIFIYYEQKSFNWFIFLQIGQDWNSGVQPRPAVIRHRLYFQIPHDPQNCAWPTVQRTSLISVPRWQSDICPFTLAQRTRLDPPSRLLQTAVVPGRCALRRRRPRLWQPARISSESSAVGFVSHMWLCSGPVRILTRCHSASPQLAQPSSVAAGRDLVQYECSP